MEKEELLKIKKKHDKKKEKHLQNKGEHEALLKQMADDWKCESAEEAQEVLADLQNDIQDFDKKIDKGTKKLKKLLKDET